MQETIFQHFIFTDFILPFLLIFVIVFAILEKTKIFGADKKQLNAIVAFVIGLIFVGVAFPKQVVSNMILFLTVALIVSFVALLLFGFIMGEDAKFPFGDSKAVKWGVLSVIIIAVGIALAVSTGIDSSVLDFFFRQNWGSSFWTNALFIVVVAVAVALVLKKTKEN
jgi:hypothetical protein